MRILLVQESDWLERGPLQQHHLMERLQARGHQIRVIDFEVVWKQKPKTSIISRRLEFTARGKAYKNSEVRVIRPPVIKMPLLDYVSIPFSHGAEIYRQVGSFRPDVVIGFGVLSTYVAMRICKRCGIPFIHYLIDAYHTLIPEKSLRLLGEMLERRTLRHSDRVHVINEQLGEYTVRLGADPHKVIVLGAGIDTKRFNPQVDGRKIRKKYQIHENEIVLFFMGLLYKFSGLKEVAYSLLGHKGEHAIKLFVLGKGDLHEELVNLKRKGLNERLILVDWQPYEKLPGYIAASDICLFPAQYNETMRDIVPIKIYEYMACGKPVITTKLPGIMREFGKEKGIVYVDNPDQVIEVAVRLSKNKQKLRKLGLRAAKHVKKYSWSNITTQFEKTLRGIQEKSWHLVK